ncbi:MAG: hypothetical protein ACFFCW_43940 [Candidatus Hodarchaeota archaeon]
MANENEKSPKNPRTPMLELQTRIIEMQNQVAGRAKGTQGFILAMTIVAFCLGVLLVVIAVAQIMLKGDFILGAFSSAGGIATVLATLWYKPMNRAQKSIGDLARLQVAYLSFNSKVTIWIQYIMAKTTKEDVEFEEARVKDVTENIEEAAKNALDQIKDICKEDTAKNSNP